MRFKIVSFSFNWAKNVILSISRIPFTQTLIIPSPYIEEFE